FGIAFLVLVAAGAALLFRATPTGFLPEEDQGAFFVEVQLPPGASVNRTAAAVERLEEIVRALPGTQSLISIVGYSFLNSLAASNSAFFVVQLAPYEEREEAGMAVQDIMARFYAEAAAVPGATVLPFNLPPIVGLGSVGGLEYELQDRAGGSIEDLTAVMRGLQVAANQEPTLAGVFSTFTANNPQVFLEIDRDKAQVLGVSIGDIFAALQATLGGYYVNDFNLFGRTWRVMIQAEAPDREKIEDIYRIHVRSASGGMVPLQSLATARLIVGPDSIDRYNNYRSVTLNGSAAPGVSTGEALETMERVSAETLPPGYGF